MPLGIHNQPRGISLFLTGIPFSPLRLRKCYAYTRSGQNTGSCKLVLIGPVFTGTSPCVRSAPIYSLAAVMQLAESIFPIAIGSKLYHMAALFHRTEAYPIWTLEQIPGLFFVQNHLYERIAELWHLHRKLTVL